MSKKRPPRTPKNKKADPALEALVWEMNASMHELAGMLLDRCQTIETAMSLGGQGKTGHSSTLQNRPFPVSGSRPIEFYRTLSPDCKSVCTFVRQLRGPHFSTCA